MVSEPPAIAVCDAGPVIHLDELGSLDLLNTFTTVQVPEAVWQEVQRHRPMALRRKQAVLQRRRVISKPSKALLDLILRFSLAKGEQEALLLMQTAAVGAVLLTDDDAARQSARQLGYEVHGTLGIILGAWRGEQCSKRRVLHLLRSIPERSTMFLREALLQEAIREVQGKRS